MIHKSESHFFLEMQLYSLVIFYTIFSGMFPLTTSQFESFFFFFLSFSANPPIFRHHLAPCVFFFFFNCCWVFFFWDPNPAYVQSHTYTASLSFRPVFLVFLHHVSASPWLTLLMRTQTPSRPPCSSVPASLLCLVVSVCVLQASPWLC